MDNHRQNLADDNKRLFEMVRFGKVCGFCLFICFGEVYLKLTLYKIKLLLSVLVRISYSR